jgi:hypothetical protein
MSTKHTQGPWHWVDPENDLEWDGKSGMVYASLRTVKEFGENRTDVIDGKHYTHFSLPKFILGYCESIEGTDESAANARLIAAAPELLEALILLEREMVESGNAQSRDYGWKPAIEKTRAAIAKATGEQA